MRAMFLVAFVLGLILGVRGMLVGITQVRQSAHTSIFSFLTIGTWLVAFGITGYLLSRYTAVGTGVSLVIAAASGVGAATGMYALIAGWAVPSAKREVEDERYSLQGHIGSVTHAIIPLGVGQITYVHNGVRRTLQARSLDGKPIATDADIVIERIEDGVAFVELWSTIEKQLEMPS